MVLLGVEFATAWFAVFLLGHLTVFHYRHVHQRASVIMRFFTLAIAGFVASVTVRLVAVRSVGHPGTDATLAVIAGLAVMTSLFILYVPFYYMVATSLSIQTLIAVQQAPAQCVPIAALQSQEFLERILEGRLDSLVESGNLIRSGEGFRLTSRGRRVARFFQGVKELWRLGPGG